LKGCEEKKEDDKEKVLESLGDVKNREDELRKPWKSKGI